MTEPTAIYTANPPRVVIADGEKVLCTVAIDGSETAPVIATCSINDGALEIDTHHGIVVILEAVPDEK